MKPKSALIVLVVALTLGLTACSAFGGSNTVKITLTDFKIESSVTEFEVGVPYHFVVTNEGENDHEIMILPPVDPEMGMDMEEMDEMALAMIEHDDLPPGATVSFDYTFTAAAPAGTLEFACHVAKHYQAGMVLPIIVK